LGEEVNVDACYRNLYDAVNLLGLFDILMVLLNGWWEIGITIN
jgi:hypothetical protein